MHDNPQLSSPADQRVFALSDLHVDYEANRRWIEALPATAYRQDVLIVAGDISDDLNDLAHILSSLQDKFAMVFFVPGNHDLWVEKGSRDDSLEKFQRVLSVCQTLGIRTHPALLKDGTWVVPLFSWYVIPEQGDNSLFMPKPGRDLTMAVWNDKNRIRWSHTEKTMADYFFGLNEPALNKNYNGAVISFSHFLPRSELIFSSPAQHVAIPLERIRKYPINFSRVAGSRQLEKQLRQLGSCLHVYGHQHRNRDRIIDGVRYVSHCLGYPQERERGHIHVDAHQPKLVWAAEPVR